MYSHTQAGAKRKRTDDDTRLERFPSSWPQSAPPISTHKRTRHTERHDLLSPLSDELLVRILSFLPLADLLNTAPLSRRFRALSADSQLWKNLYYARFVLPRALRIPGFRDGSARERKLHYASRKTVWADGRKGGWVDMDTAGGGSERRDRGDWKRQYKLRHNWSLGKCAVEELSIRGEEPGTEGSPQVAGHDRNAKTLVKVSEGVAITADLNTGLRAWDLKTKALLAQSSIVDAKSSAGPSCIALDDQKLSEKLLDVAIGFADGGFGVWRVDLGRHTVIRRYRHEKSSNGGLAGMAYSHPYLLTATKAVLVSLYTFNISENLPQTRGPPSRRGHPIEPESETERESATESHTEDEYENRDPRSRRFFDRGRIGDKKSKPGLKKAEGVLLPAPYLLTSLKSHTSRDPLALSIRKSAGSTTVASIAYTFSTIQGWSLGIQDLHIHPPLPTHAGPGQEPSASSEIVTSRLAYTLPVRTAPHRRRRMQAAAVATRRWRTGPATGSMRPTEPGSDNATTQDDIRNAIDRFFATQSSTEDFEDDEEQDEGPISICYTHPYLLATLPDNTLILHLCTSTSTSLSISPGIRLWGHTSGISDAEITARGKAVSVSCRGDEIRVWELEGRGNGSSNQPFGSLGVSGQSTASSNISSASNGSIAVRPMPRDQQQEQWEDRRNWVGFDDEMVIVLKETRDGKESLLVYDFT